MRSLFERRCVQAGIGLGLVLVLGCTGDTPPASKDSWAYALRQGESALPTAAHQWSGHQGAATALAFTENGKTLVSIGYDDYRLCVWSAADGRRLDERRLDHRPCDMAPLADGNRVAVVDTKGKVTIWSIFEGKLEAPVTLRGDAGRSPRIAAGPRGAYLATTGFGFPAFVWSLDENMALDPLPDSETLRGIAIAPDGESVVAGTQGNEFVVWSLDRGKGSNRKTHEIPKATAQSDVASLAVSPDGRYLATGHMDASVSLWDYKKKKQIHDFFVQDASARDVAFCPDGSVFATAQQNSRVYLWDVETGIELAILSDHKGPAVSVAFDAHNPGVFASGSETGDIVLWR